MKSVYLQKKSNCHAYNEQTVICKLGNCNEKMVLKVIDLREISSYTELVFRFLFLSLILFRFLVLILILQGYEYALYSQLPLITMSKNSFLECSSKPRG